MQGVEKRSDINWTVEALVNLCRDHQFRKSSKGLAKGWFCEDNKWTELASYIALCMLFAWVQGGPSASSSSDEFVPALAADRQLNHFATVAHACLLQGPSIDFTTSKSAFVQAVQTMANSLENVTAERMTIASKCSALPRWRTLLPGVLSSECIQTWIAAVR